MKKLLVLILAALMILTAAACGGGDKKAAAKQESAGVDKLVEEYGFQWQDTKAPILNEKGAKELSFSIYSSKNASALDYNDMKIMQDLYASTNVFVSWENVSESVYSQQKNLIFGNADNRPDAIYHAGMGAGEIIKYAKRKAAHQRLSGVHAQLLQDPGGAPRHQEPAHQRGGRQDLLPAPHRGDGPAAEPQHPVPEQELGQGRHRSRRRDGRHRGRSEGRSEPEGGEAMLRYFRDNDMNGNGKTDDERPLSFVYNNWQGNQCDLYGMFGLNDNLEHRIIVDGKVTYTVLDERFKEATNFLANWVSENLIDKVSFELSQDNFLANGKGLETYGAFYWWESETVVSNPENYIVCNPIIGPHGDQTLCISNNPEVGAGEVIIFADCPNVEVLLAYFDRYYDPLISAQINYGPIGIVYDEQLDEKGMLVQKPLPEGVTSDELRLQNAPLGIIYLSDYAWNNVVNMEPRAKLRLERLTAHATPFMPANVKPCYSNLQFTLDELNTLANYETNLNDYIRTNLIKWLMGGGVSDAQWETFQKDLNGKCNITGIQKVYQDAYDRYIGK